MSKTQEKNFFFNFILLLTIFSQQYCRCLETSTLQSQENSNHINEVVNFYSKIEDEINNIIKRNNQNEMMQFLLQMNGYQAKILNALDNFHKIPSFDPKIEEENNHLFDCTMEVSIPIINESIQNSSILAINYNTSIFEPNLTIQNEDEDKSYEMYENNVQHVLADEPKFFDEPTIKYEDIMNRKDEDDYTYELPARTYYSSANTYKELISKQWRQRTEGLYEKRKKILGEDHPATILLKENLEKEKELRTRSFVN